MKTKVNAVIVVEGKSDVSFLNEFIDAEFVITNGSSVPIETIEYLKNISSKKDIIVLTDPDYPGISIRNVLNKEIANLKHAYIRKEVSIKKNKVGVAESTKDEVLNALSNIAINKSNEIGHLSNLDMYNLKLTGYENSKELREYVSNYFHLGYTNSKTLLKRLNQMNISYENIYGCLNGKK